LDRYFVWLLRLLRFKNGEVGATGSWRATQKV